MCRSTSTSASPRGSARGVAWLVSLFLTHPDARIRKLALLVLQQTATYKDASLLGDPLLEVLLNDTEISVRNAALEVLQVVWCGAAPAAARHRLVGLLRAQRDGDTAFDPLPIDEYCWLMESCCKMLSLAKDDPAVVEGLVAFFKSEVEQLLPDRRGLQPDTDIRCFQMCSLLSCLETLKSVSRQRLDRGHVASVVDAFDASAAARKDKSLKKAICKLRPRDGALAAAVRWYGRPVPRGNRASKARGQRSITEYFRKGR